jgi:hypothetical protein
MGDLDGHSITIGDSHAISDSHGVTVGDSHAIPDAHGVTVSDSYPIPDGHTHLGSRRRFRRITAFGARAPGSSVHARQW